MSMDVQQIIQTLSSPASDRSLKFRACRACRELKNEDKENQTILGRAGVVPLLSNLYMSEVWGEENDGGEVCRAVQTLCFAHEENSGLFVTQHGFLDHVLRIVSADSISAAETSASMFRNIAANTWPYHLRYGDIVKKICEILLEDQKDDQLLQRSNRLVNSLIGIIVVISYNPIARPMLLKERADEVMIYMMRKEDDDLDLENVGCAIGVANLVGDQENHPALDISNSSFLIEQIIECCKATLRGEYYPPHRKVKFMLWRLAMGISNLCKSESNKTELVKGGIVPILAEILVRSEDVRQTTYSLEGIWHISSQNT